MSNRSDGADRRGFLRAAGLAAVGTALTGGGAYAQAPATAPAAPPQPPPTPPAQQGPRLLQMPGKARIVVLQDRPLVAQTPENMLDDDTTPTDKFYVRNNGLIPEISGNRLMVSVRLMRQGEDDRLHQASDDASFELTLCS